MPGAGRTWIRPELTGWSYSTASRWWRRHDRPSQARVVVAGPKVAEAGCVGSSNLTLPGLRGQGELNLDVVEDDATTKLETRDRHGADIHSVSLESRHRMNDEVLRRTRRVRRNYPRRRGIACSTNLDLIAASEIQRLAGEHIVETYTTVCRIPRRLTVAPHERDLPIHITAQERHAGFVDAEFASAAEGSRDDLRILMDDRQWTPRLGRTARQHDKGGKQETLCARGPIQIEG